MSLFEITLLAIVGANGVITMFLMDRVERLKEQCDRYSVSRIKTQKLVLALTERVLRLV